MKYLTQNQLNFILENHYFNEPFTQSVVNYTNYRGKVHAVVHTLKFKWPFDENFVNQKVVQYLLTHFKLNTQLLASTSYDLILSQPQTQSFYIWRANSNAQKFDEADETLLILNYNNVYKFVRQACQINIPSLNINFESSNVVIHEPLAVVLSFVKI